MNNTPVKENKPKSIFDSKGFGKSVEAIHVAGDISFLERKVFNALLFRAGHQGHDQTEYEVNIKDICADVGFNSNDWNKIKIAITSLVSTPIEWGFWSDKKKKQRVWGASAFLADAEIEEGTGRLSFSISNKLKQRLLVPEMFAYLNMEIQRNLTTGYQLNLYENCVRYRRIGHTPWWPLDVFRSLMNVPGGDYYKEFKKLNLKVIKTAMKGVNNISDISVEPEYKKQGRRIVEIRFLINDNLQMPLWKVPRSHYKNKTAKIEQSPEEKVFYESINKYRIRPLSIVHDLIKEHGLETAIIIRDYGEKMIKQNSVSIEKQGGYIANCFRNKYGLNESKRTKENQIQKQAQIDKENEKNALKKKENEEWKEKIESKFDSLPQKEQDQLIEEFKQSLSKHDLDNFELNGFNSQFIKGLFYSPFLSNEFNLPMPQN